MKRISIIGTGYVGLVQGVMMAENGFNIICMDTDKSKIKSLSEGVCPIYEPGLGEMLNRNIDSKRLEFTTDMRKTVENSDILFIAVGTPSREDGQADLTYVYEVASSIGKYMNGYKIVVDKSTVPIGTARVVESLIKTELENRGVGFEFSVVSNPEFLREGKAVRDSSTPDRIVIGADDEKALDIMKEVYQTQYLNSTPVFTTNIETAEMIKYASNAFLAVKISFINEMALLADKVGADITEVAKGMGMDGRISPKFLRAGPGYGGSCFPKDTKAIVEIAKQHGEEMLVIKSAIEANEKQKAKIAEKIISSLDANNDLRGKRICIWGLSFKPETDDMRDAPSIDIIRTLVKAGAEISAFCPEGMREAAKYLKDIENHITYCKNEYEAAKDSDAVVLITEWAVFRGVDLYKIRNSMKGNNLFDLRHVFIKNPAVKNIFNYYSIGVK